MHTFEEKLNFDIYIEGNLITGNLAEIVKKQSKILEDVIYRGIFAPNIILKIENDINKYYCNKITSFSKIVR